jgi:phosphoglycerate dehydrogenase-like enzyme
VAVNPNLVAIEPKSIPLYETAVKLGGGTLAPIGSEVGGLIWVDYRQPETLASVLKQNPQLEWVQLPWAGVDAFAHMLHLPFKFTSAKGSYREPVAEHALMLCMALGRRLPERVLAKSWGEKFAVSLYDANVVIVGGGGITEELLLQLAPFRAKVTVVRNRQLPLAGAQAVVTLDRLDEVLLKADFVILACALTEETRGLFDARRLGLMSQTAYLVNVARGPVIDTDALCDALDAGVIAGAGVDVTDPEPLPDGHRAWTTPNLIITPHTADTPRQVQHFFAIRIEANVSAYLGKSDWVGVVDPELGY